jgi:Flp pilus assembly protein TadG
MMMRLGGIFLRDTRAAAAAEMVLILPMAFALIFTTMEAGYYFQTEHKAIKYVREGARFAARQRFENFDCSGAGAFSGPTTVSDQIRNVTLSGFPASTTPRIADWQTGDINIQVSCGSPNGTAYGTGLYAGTADKKAPRVLVWTRFSYTPILGLLGFDVRNIDVVAQAEAPVTGI